MSVGKPTANHRQAETHILPSSRKRHPGQVPTVSAGSFPHDTHNRLYLPCCPNYDRNRKLGHDNIADINTLTRHCFVTIAGSRQRNGPDRNPFR